MRRPLLLALGVSTLSACHPAAPPEVVVMPATTTLPTSVGATADLPVTLTVVNGCTTFSNVKILERTATGLSLQAWGTKQQPCPAIPNAAPYTYTYTDTGSPARTNPFEVWVNGNKAGTVNIQESNPLPQPVP